MMRKYHVRFGEGLLEKGLLKATSLAAYSTFWESNLMRLL
jgi:hypothetical protein